MTLVHCLHPLSLSLLMDSFPPFSTPFPFDFDDNFDNDLNSDFDIALLTGNTSFGEKEKKNSRRGFDGAEWGEFSDHD